jgi:hypothetical protein
MTFAICSINSLLSNCDSAFPSAGSYGYLTLLKGGVVTGLGYTANATNNALTTATAHGMVTGSRLRLVGGTIPTPLLANTDYFVIKTSATVLTLATSLANALASVSIDLTDAGTGTLTLTEQALTAADPLSVLVNKEIVHPSWTERALIDNLGAATAVLGVAQKPIKGLTVSNNGTTAMSYAYYLVIASTAVGSAVLGSVPSSGFALVTVPAVTIAPGDPPRVIQLKISVRNP